MYQLLGVLTMESIGNARVLSHLRTIFLKFSADPKLVYFPFRLIVHPSGFRNAPLSRQKAGEEKISSFTTQTTGKQRVVLRGIKMLPILIIFSDVEKKTQ